MGNIMGKWDSRERYAKENTKRYVVKVNKNTEQEIIEKLDSIENKMGYIKKLIREDIARSSGTRITVNVSKPETEISDEFTEPE